MIEVFDKIEIKKIKSSSKIYQDVVLEKNTVDNFYHYKSSLAGCLEALDDIKFENNKRDILVDVLSTQYKKLNLVNHNIDLLKDSKTFTVTTGHQLCLMGGPLFFIYKIASIIKICKELKTRKPDFNFVPVFWLANEDHDKEEINHFYLFNKKYIWETNQTGSVGDFSLTGLDGLMNEIKDLPQTIKDCYLTSSNLTDATSKLVGLLFGKHGVVVLDASQKELKQLFVDQMKQEISTQKSNELIQKTNKKLLENDFHNQIFSREINLFYKKSGFRERIIKEKDYYYTLNKSIQFTENEILKDVDLNPENYSPNVCLRPCYQQTILPNIAYIGGAAEVAYWGQLASIFEPYQSFFPAVLPRFSALILPEKMIHKMIENGFSNDQLLFSESQLKESLMSKWVGEELYLKEEKKDLELLFEKINSKKSNTTTIDGYLKSQENAMMDILDKISKKMIKEEELKQEQTINQINNIHKKIFPNGVLQERHDNFLNFYINNNQFVDNLVQICDPFDFQLNILKY